MNYVIFYILFSHFVKSPMDIIEVVCIYSAIIYFGYHDCHDVFIETIDKYINVYIHIHNNIERFY